MKGIVLAGGTGSRLFPITYAVSKQLLPIGGKPMIYYPLTILMMANIREIAIISTPEDLPSFKKLLGDGSRLGLKITYIPQPSPDGIAQAFILAEDFIAGDSVALILGDNIFHSHDMKGLFSSLKSHERGGIVFGYEVMDPSRYGVVVFDKNKQVTNIIEKPKNPPSNYAVTGLYFYDRHVVDFAKQLKPSLRGELEITDLNVLYLKEGRLRVEILERGFAWLDTGTHEDLHNASSYVDVIQKRQGILIGCIEEVAFDMGFISLEKLHQLASDQSKSAYGKYLQTFVQRKLSSQSSAASFSLS